MDSKKLNEPLLDRSDVYDYETIGFGEQVKLLTFKNFLITFKNPKNIIFLIITPFLLSAFLYFFQSLALDNGNLLIPDPSSSPLPAFPKCSWSDCVTLDIRIASNTSTSTLDTYPWIKQLHDSFTGKGYDVNVGTDIVSTFAGLQAYYSELQQNPNKTQIGLLLCGDNVFAPGDSINNFCGSGKDYTYYLVLKKLNTLATIFHAINEPFPLDLTAAALKNYVDNFILSYELNQQVPKPQATMDFQASRFPLGPNRYIQNYDIVTAIGAFYYMITPLFVFLFIQNEIVREKEYKLRQGLNIFGASHTAYWISWFLITLIYSLICSVASYLAGLSFGFGFFADTPFYIIILMLLFPFNLALAMIGFLVATLAPNAKASNTASYAIVLLAIVVQSFVSDNNLLTFIFTSNASSLVSILRAFLVIYPPFSFTKIFTNITIFSGYHFDITQRSWITGPHPYDWSTFVQSTSGPLPFGGGTFDRYSDLESMFILYADAALYALLAWYCDNVVSTNRGRGESLLFPIYRLMKLFGYKGKSTQKVGINIRSKAFGEGSEESAIKERNRVYQNSEKNIPALGLRIKCLSKTFKGGCSKQEVNAINELSIEIQPSQLMAVLGHNGAGKTTLINILTGILDPDDNQETEIIINRESISNIDQIRKHIGLCAQFDILWNEITAQQHLEMFARLKGIPKYERPQKIQELLEMVGLGREGKNEVKGFSGGMRRRLSLAIAAIGDPRIILLDEPTTGLDPKVRQQVWKLIEKMKRTRSIILTTHSMEQADVLSDRVCVMVKGKIKCIGTTVFLKQEYGQGHRLTLNIDRNEVSSVQQTLKKLCPTAVMIDYKGGNLVVGINEFQNLLKAIKMLQSEESHGLEEYDLKKSIRDWNVSDATLEEVFMSVSKERE